MTNYFLWPHANRARLIVLLQNKMVDLRANTPGFAVMTKGDKVYFCLPHGEYIVSATIAGSPYALEKPLNEKFSFAVNLDDIEFIDPPITTGRSPRGVTLVPGPITLR